MRAPSMIVTLGPTQVPSSMTTFFVNGAKRLNYYVVSNFGFGVDIG